MSDQALIQRNDAALAISFTPAAVEMQENALAISGIIGKVTNAAENEAGVAAQVELQRVIKLVEKARKEAKEPVLEYGRKIDAAAKSFTADLNSEMIRVSALVGDFQTLEQAKARAAEQAKSEELTALEREKAEALAKVESHEQADAIHEHYNELAARISGGTTQPVRADGQAVKTEWEIEVTNPFDLAKFHPHCVTITPRLTEIKQLLNEGVQVRGISAKKVIKSTVRLSPTRTIDV